MTIENSVSRDSKDHDSDCSWALYLLPNAYERRHGDILVLDDLRFESPRHANPGSRIHIYTCKFPALDSTRHGAIHLIVNNNERDYSWRSYWRVAQTVSKDTNVNSSWQARYW